MSERPRVLACDDEPQILRALKVILRDAGYEAVTAESGEEALDLASVRPPAAAIVDLMLPDIDGIEVTERLREWSEMPVIVLSAVGEEEATVEIGGLTVALAAHSVSRGGEEIHLTPTEFQVLRVLVRNRGRLMTHRALLTEVWGPAWSNDTATLRTHVANLRRKIEVAGGEELIRTDPGVGYRIAL